MIRRYLYRGRHRKAGPVQRLALRGLLFAAVYLH